VWPDLLVTFKVVDLEDLLFNINLIFTVSTSGDLSSLEALDIHCFVNELDIEFSGSVAELRLHHSVSSRELFSSALALLLDILAVAHQVSAIWVTSWSVECFTFIAFVGVIVALSIFGTVALASTFSFIHCTVWVLNTSWWGSTPVARVHLLLWSALLDTFNGINTVATFSTVACLACS
jgi:hypothetical protein